MAYNGNNNYYGNKGSGGVNNYNGKNREWGKDVILPPDFKEFKLLNDNGKLTDNLFCNIADEISKSFVSNGKGVSERQFRRIFDEIKRFDIKLQNETKSWDDLKPYIQMLNSKVAYAVARSKERAKNDDIIKKGYENFKSFIECGIKQSNSKDNYHYFTCLIEAVYGFYYSIKPKDNNN